jgi:hypothetical protein
MDPGLKRRENQHFSVCKLNPTTQRNCIACDLTPDAVLQTKPLFITKLRVFPWIEPQSLARHAAALY